MTEDELCAHDRTNLQKMDRRMRWLNAIMLCAFMLIGGIGLNNFPENSMIQFTVVLVGAGIILFYQTIATFYTKKFAIWNIWNTSMGYSLSDKDDEIARLQTELAAQRILIEQYKARLVELGTVASTAAGEIQTLHAQAVALQQSTVSNNGPQQGQVMRVTQQG